MRVLALLVVLSLLSTPAFAGGSVATVHVQKLTMLSDVDYILVVRPVSGKISFDERMSGCKEFEVHGTLKRLKSYGRSSGTPTKNEHLDAIAYLKKFENSTDTIYLGWIGEGFQIINPKNPCIVKSRGLRHQGKDVLSFFWAV